MKVTQLFRLMLLCAVIFSGIFVINHFRLSKHFPIKSVRVYGLNHIDQQDVQNTLAPLLTRGFFNINVEYIRDRLLQHPWAAEISVRRTWPDSIEVTVLERQPIARWDSQTLLSANGDLFSPKQDTCPDHLPIFVGPTGKQILMLNYFNEINRILIPLHASISYLELTPYLTWKVKLDNGITVQVGHKEILTRFSHFVKVYPKIIGDHSADVDSIDLRYPNGMAVRWKTTGR